jgi:hypothetical protein
VSFTRQTNSSASRRVRTGDGVGAEHDLNPPCTGAAEHRRWVRGILQGFQTASVSVELLRFIRIVVQVRSIVNSSCSVAFWGVSALA